MACIQFSLSRFQYTRHRNTHGRIPATGGSQGFLRLIRWGYVHLLLIQGYVPGWIRFVRQFLVCVHSDVIVTCLLIWMYFYSGSRGDTVQTVTVYIPFCMDHLPKRYMMSVYD